MNRRTFLGAAAAGALRLARPAPAQNGKPNIILVLADDLGYGDLGCYGQQRIDTSNIDRLAAEGLRFTQAYAGSTVCAPSRSCLMTGTHTGHIRIRGNSSPVHGRVPLRPEDTTVAEVLQQAGYRNAAFGKWGLGEISTSGTPNHKGFDEFFGYLNQSHAHDYYPEHLWHNEEEVFLRGNLGGYRQQYSHDLIVDRALAFIEKNHQHPFFLYLPLAIPHANNERGSYLGDGMEVPSYEPYATEPWPNPEKGFAAMITRMDRDLGRLMALLQKLGIDSQTLLLFTSDNGPHREGGHDPEFFASRGGLRGIKRDLYEGGIRVPLIARWPGKIPAGETSHHVCAFWDFLPTAAEIAGIQPPRGIDGISMAPALFGGQQTNHNYLYWEYADQAFHQAVRLGDSKAVRNGLSSPIELYDLNNDLAEGNNLAGRHRDVVERIERIFTDARTDSEAFPIPEREPIEG